MAARRALRLGVLITALALAHAAPAAAQDCAGADVVAQGGKLGPATKATLCLVDVERAKTGLPALKAAGELKKAAKGHSRDMVANRYFAHDSPGGSTILSRAKDAGYLNGVKAFVLRENIGWGGGKLSSPREVVKAWMASAPHRLAILNPVLTEAGVGVAKGSPFGGPGATYTLAFGMRRR